MYLRGVITLHCESCRQTALPLPSMSAPAMGVSGKYPGHTALVAGSPHLRMCKHTHEHTHAPHITHHIRTFRCPCCRTLMAQPARRASETYSRLAHDCRAYRHAHAQRKDDNVLHALTINGSKPSVRCHVRRADDPCVRAGHEVVLGRFDAA
jgi:hypothetical protein